MMWAVSDISQRGVKWKDNNESETQCVSQVALKCHFESVNPHHITEGLQEATSRWLQHGWFNTAAAMVNFVHYARSLWCFHMNSLQLNSFDLYQSAI